MRRHFGGIGTLRIVEGMTRWEQFKKSFPTRPIEAARVELRCLKIDRLQPAGYVWWLDILRDTRATGRVLARVERLSAGNQGDARPDGDGRMDVQQEDAGIRCLLEREGVRQKRWNGAHPRARVRRRMAI